MTNGWNIPEPIRGTGWIWREGMPIVIEYESGFSPVDAFPYCYEVGKVGNSVSPVPTKEMLIESQRLVLSTQREALIRKLEDVDAELHRIAGL